MSPILAHSSRLTCGDRARDLLSSRLTGWRQTSVSTFERDQLAAALAAGLPAGPILVCAELIMTGLCAEYRLDSQAARANFGADIAGALTVSVHTGSPDVIREQVNRINYFLRQPPVRQRMAWRAKPLITIDRLANVERINPDGSVTYGLAS